MEFFKEYWWCFVVFAVIVALAIVGLCIGHNDSKKAKEIVEAEKQKETNEQTPKADETTENDNKANKNEEEIVEENEIKVDDKKEE